METIAKTCVICLSVKLESYLPRSVVTKVSKLSPPVYSVDLNTDMFDSYHINQRCLEILKAFYLQYERTTCHKVGNLIITTLSFNMGNSDVDYEYTFSYYDYLSDVTVSSYCSPATSRDSYTTFSDYDSYFDSSDGEDSFNFEQDHSTIHINQSGYEPGIDVGNTTLSYYMCFSKFVMYLFILCVSYVWGSNSILTAIVHETTTFFEWITTCNFHRFRLSNIFVLPLCWYVFACNISVLDTEIYPYLAGELAMTGKPYDEPYATMCGSRCLNYAIKCTFFRIIRTLTVQSCPYLKLPSFKWWDRLMFIPCVLSPFPYWFFFIFIWIFVHVGCAMYCCAVTLIHYSTLFVEKNQSGIESDYLSNHRNGQVEIILFVPTARWDLQYDRLVYYNFRTHIASYLVRTYDTNLEIGVTIVAGRPHVLVKVCLHENVSHDPLLDSKIYHFNNFLSGIYQENFHVSPLDTFWEWSVYGNDGENQSGRENKKLSRKEHTRRVNKKEKKEALTSFVDNEDYMIIRRGILNLNKVTVDVDVLDNMTEVCVKKKMLKLFRTVETMMSARERIDRRLNLPINQSGDENKHFSLDSLLGNDSQFYKTMSMLINANLSHLSAGECTKLLFQMSMWSYEIVTADSLFSFIRKVTLLCTHVFPEVCSMILENIVSGLFPTSVNQAGLETFAAWSRELKKMWSSSESNIVGHLKKMVLVIAAGTVFGSKLESYSPTEILTAIVKPSQTEIDKTSPVDIIGYMIEALTFFTQAAADAYATGDILVFFRLRSPAVVVSDNMVDIMNHYNRFHTYGLSMLDIPVQELRNKCLKTRDMLKTCQGHPQLGGLLHIRTMFYNLDRIIAECDAGFKCKPLKEQPFVVVAHGMPETGKSAVCTKVWQSIATKNGYDCSPTSTCHINPSDKYQSTAENQYHVHLDDFNQPLGTKADSVNNSMLLLRMANPVPFFTNQAELSKKGNNVLNPKVITITSQTVHMYAHEDVHEPGAIHRRVTVFIEVLIKPEFSTAGGSIDHAKLNGTSDIHLLNVTRPVAVGITNDGKQIIKHKYVEFDFGDGNGLIALHKVSMRQCCHAVVELFGKHMAREAIQLDKVMTVDACPHSMPKNCCYLCEINQSDANVYLADQKQLVGSFVSYKLPKAAQTGKARSTDEAAYQAEIAQVLESDQENHAGFDLECLYSLAVLAPAYLWSLPRLSVHRGTWKDPHNWYGNFIASVRVERAIGWKAKIAAPSLICGFATMLPCYWFIPSWILCSIPIFCCSLVGVPIVAHDLFLVRAKDWTIKQYLAFESKMRYMRWLKDRKHQAVAGFIALVTGVISFVAYNLIFREKSEQQVNNGGEFSSLSSAKATVIPGEWQRPVHIISYIENSGNITRDQLIGNAAEPGVILKRSAYCVDEGKKSTNAFPVCANYWLLPYHYLVERTGRITFLFSGPLSNGARFCWTPGPEGLQWIKLPNHDIALCHVPDLPPQKDMRCLLTNEWAMPNTGVMLYKNIADGQIALNTIPVVLQKRGSTTSSSDSSVKYDCLNYVLIGTTTRGGMCMSPIIGDQKHPVILGFHLKGIGSAGTADILKLADVEEGISQLQASPLTTRPVCSDQMRLVGGVNTTDVHPKHVGRFVPDTEGISFIGHAEKITRRAPKMSTTHTPIYDAVLDQFGIEDKWTSPPTKPAWMAHHMMLQNLCEPASPDPALVARAYEDYKDQLVEHFDRRPESLAGIRKMTLNEALIGVPGVKGFESLNMSTSKGHVGVLFEGYTNGGRKSEVLEVKYEDEEGKPCFEVTCPDKLLEELDILENQAASLQRVGFVSALNYKDETLKQTKVCARLFSALPMHFIILQRIYFLAFTKWFRDYNFVTECAVGINATSPLWNTFALYLRTYEYNIAGDYKAFDQKSIAMFLICCYNIIMFICQLAGYSERDLNVMSALVMDLIYPIFDFNGDLVMSNGGNPSGHSMTVIVNCIMNSLYMRYCFFKLLPHLIKFQSLVKLITYGDDNVLSVARSIRNIFNQNSISRVLGEIGIVYTDAHKSLVFEDFVPFEDVTFLKRSFVYREEFGGFMAPLELDSIYKSLLYHVPSRAEGVLVEHQMAQSILSASDEIFLHGREVFDIMQPKLELIVAGYGIRHMMVERFFDGYDTRVKSWWETYEDQKFVDQSGVCDYVSHGVRVRASSNNSGFLNQKLRLLIGYLIIFVALLLPQMVKASVDCKIMQLGRFVDSQYLSETNWVTEMIMKTSVGALQQTLDFADGTPQTSVSYNTAMANETMAMSTGDMQLGDFFSRPILIQTISWTPDLAGFGTSIDPWTLFFGNKRVINRINNFNLLSANLHVKAVINGNGFYYGRVMMDYMPLYDYDNTSQFSLTSTNTLVSASQRLNLQIDPTTSTGGEMILPFIWFKDKISIPLAEWSYLGQLFFRQINLLKHANAATTPIEINVYAWAENVELSIPTSTNSTALINQSGDEYGLDKFSEAATAIAGLADSVNPTSIGTYVRASQLAVAGASKMAKLMGLSRPPDNDSTPVRRKATTNLVNTDASDGSTKLTIDSKQELSIGPEALNLWTGDELNIATICAKQSYLTTAYWDLTHGVGDPLFYSKVSPLLHATEAVPVQFYPTAMMYASLPFRYWRGKVKFRFQIVASSFHRGRLLVTWNPTTTASSELNVVCSTVMDLDKERECVLEVPWGQASSFLQVATPVLATTGWITNPGAAVLSIDNLFDNGIVSVYVLNTLAVPNTTATALVGLNVYVSMEEAEFAVPDDVIVGNISVSENQSGVEPDIELPMPIDVSTTRTLENTNAVDTLMHMYMGERIANFRTLLKRYCFNMATVVIGATTKNRQLQQSTFASFPPYQGTRVGGYYTGVNIMRTTFINYLTPCFLAQRGGVRLKLVSNSGLASGTAILSLRRTRSTAYTNTTTTLNEDATAAAESLQNAESTFAYAGSGVELSQPSVQPSIEVEVPFQRNDRFALAKNVSNFTPYAPVMECVHLSVVTPTVSATATKLNVNHYVAAAEDFSLLLWQGPPAFTIVSLV